MSGTTPTLLRDRHFIGRNEGARLERCFQSVNAIRNWQGPVETIYVDSGSTDASCALARSFGHRVIEVSTDRPSAATGRNAGWRAALGPLVLFLDGDTILDPDFPVLAAAAMDHLDIAVVCGTRREIHPEASLYNRVLDLDWIWQAGPAEYCGGDALIRRKKRAASGRQWLRRHTHRRSEEPDMCRRMRGLGLRIVHLDCAMTGHDLAMRRWNQYWKRAVRTGHAYAEVSQRYAGTEFPLDARIAGQPQKRGAFWVAFWVFAASATLLLRSPLPLMAALFFLGALSVRTARKFAWKSSDKTALLFYGLHSHLQQFCPLR